VADADVWLLPNKEEPCGFEPKIELENAMKDPTRSNAM
jgi:hypothetical protein